MDKELKKNNFINECSFHPPSSESIKENHEFVREMIKYCGINLIKACPESEELDKVLEKLREAMFWANAAIAIHQ